VANPLIWISFIASLLYFATQHWQPFPGSIVLKGLSVSPLAVMAWRMLPGLALAFGSLGDVLLDWNADLFPAGLGAFLIGHFVYIGLFWRNRPKRTRLPRPEKLIVIALGLFVAIMSFYLLPPTGQLAPAVAMYMGALTGMVMSAVALQLPERWVMAGALLFLLSDTILAVSKFKNPLPGREFLIWPSYYAGQALIAVGFLRAKGVKVP
jgi:uncharacterized membrane protein YhhN